MRTADFDYSLPAELIAQDPVRERDQSRLMVLQRPLDSLAHRHFSDLPGYLRAGDLLVFNNSRVIPARLRALNKTKDGALEILLLEENQVNDWWAMVRPGKRAKKGAQILFLALDRKPAGVQAIVSEVNVEGHRRLIFSGRPNISDALDILGEIPLPPYITRERPRETDRDRYQTVYATTNGSIAAPTAGLHFTNGLMEKISGIGAEICYITLHVGAGTFAPVKAASLAEHVMHQERFEVSEKAARMINDAKRDRRRVIAVGTTTLRVLESVALENNGHIMAGIGRTRIFVHPPFEFRMVDALLTNFHLPRSTLLMLVSAFASPGKTQGRETILAAYAEAIRERYRFFSYGDAMLIL